METHKIKNKKVIDFIYWVLTTLLGAGGILILLSVLFFFQSIFKTDYEPFFPVVDIPINIYENAFLELKSGEQYEILIDDAYLSFNVNNEYGFAGVLNYLFFILMLLIAFYVLYLLWKIVKSIRSTLKTDNPFHSKNTWRIRKIALAILLSAMLEMIYPMILKYFWFEKVIMFEKSFDLKLNFVAGIDLFWALIVFVVAEIYRIGLEVKKEQELTI
ncbi:MAG: DUF2975 domain-containing protein [Bacteroidales bacterium]|nr:DUF2975 domain-containing protein [Bacteroidales bacterium]